MIQDQVQDPFRPFGNPALIAAADAAGIRLSSSKLPAPTADVASSEDVDGILEALEFLRQYQGTPERGRQCNG